MDLEVEFVKQHIGMLKQTINVWMIMIKTLNDHMQNTQMQIICMDGQCQKLAVNGFKWAENLSKFNYRFIKNYNENSDKGYILEVDVEYQKNLLNSHRDLPFPPKRRRIRGVEKLFCSIEDK